MVKLEKICGLFQEISFTVITWNTESNFTCRLKNHFLFDWDTLTYPGPQIQHWMWSWRNILKIIGTLMKIENCRMHGQVSQDSLYWVKSHRMDLLSPGGDWQDNRRPQGKTMYGQKCGNVRLMHRNAKRSNKLAIEKPKLENARRLRGIFLHWPWWWGIQEYNEKCS